MFKCVKKVELSFLNLLLYKLKIMFENEAFKEQNNNKNLKIGNS